MPDYRENNDEMRPLKKDGVMEQEMDQELILSDPGTGQIHVLNETTKVIWNLADGKHTLGEIEMEVRARFAGADRHDIRADVEQAVITLKKKNLLK